VTYDVTLLQNVYLQHGVGKTELRRCRLMHCTNFQYISQMPRRRLCHII